MRDIGKGTGIYGFFGKEKRESLVKLDSRKNRGDKIRTCGLYVPNVALYQTEPHLAMMKGLTAMFRKIMALTRKNQCLCASRDSNPGHPD